MKAKLAASLIPLSILTLIGCPVALAQDESQAPLDLGLREQVEVQLVLVDFLVLGRRGRTVPDLKIDDFVLVVDGRDVEIASLDLDCPVGAAEDPRPGPAAARPQLPPTAQPRRIVLVFDYFHMTNVGETFDLVQNAMNQWPARGDEHMVASLGDVVRIETPFTDDLDEVRWALQRMRNDPDLYAGNHASLTEIRFFERIQMLFDLLERVPGRKMIVLFSGPFIPDGFTHDPAYRELSAMSVTARTAVYPVDTGGLRTLTDPLVSRLGGPPMLRRLANETGGRMTSDTNAIGVAYAKAQRDLSCTYTLGFYDNRPRLDDERRLTIRVKDQRGLRVVYPEFYVIRSPEKKRESLFRTAAMTPQMFESDELSTDLFILGPHSANRWRTLLAVEIRPSPERFIEEDEEWVLRGLVRKPNGTVMHSFKRRVPLPATNRSGEQTPLVTVFQPLRARPGRYIVSAVLSDPDGETPLAATRSVVVSKIPRGEPFLIGPILGLRSGNEASETSRGRKRRHPEFEPLMQPEAEQGEPLDSLTLICVVGSEGPLDVPSVARAISSRNGDGAQSFDPVSVRLPGKSNPHCHELVDRVSTAMLEPGRYELEAVAETSQQITHRGSVEFTIQPAGAD